MNTNDSPNSAQAASPTPEPVPYRDRWRRNDDQRLSAGLLDGEAGPTATSNVLVDALDLAARELEAQANDPDQEMAIKAASAARQALASFQTQADIGKDAGERARECTICGAVVAEWPTVMCRHCYEMPWKLRAAALSPSPVKDVLEAAEWTKDAARELHAGMIQAARDCAGSHGAPQSAVREAGSMFLYAAIRNLAGQSREADK